MRFSPTSRGTCAWKRPPSRRAGVIDPGRAQVEERFGELRGVGHAHERAPRTLGDLAEQARALTIRAEQERVDHDPVIASRRHRLEGFVLVRLAVRKEENGARRVRPCLGLEALERHVQPRGQVRAPSAVEVAQSLEDGSPIGRQRHAQLRVPIEGHDADANVARGREVLHQPDGACRPEVFRVAPAQTLGAVEHEDQVEMSYAPEDGRSAPDIDRRLRAFEDVSVRRLVDLHLKLAHLGVGRSHDSQEQAPTQGRRGPSPHPRPPLATTTSCLRIDPAGAWLDSCSLAAPCCRSGLALRARAATIHPEGEPKVAEETGKRRQARAAS
jgi:hypothetical protein